MNKENLVLMRFYRLVNMVRDCLEVALNDNEINQDIYNARAKFFETVLNDPMIQDFFAKNGEAGSTLKRNLELIYNDFYVTKRVINIKEEKYYADHASRIKILDYIIGTYQSLSDVIQMFVNDLKGKELLDPRVSDLVVLEDDYYRSLVMFAIFKNILEYNKELHDELKATGGKTNPQINFTYEELKKMVGFLRFVKDHYKGSNTAISETFESIILSLKFLDGSIKTSEPKEIDTKIQETQRFCVSLIQSNEKPWALKFQEILNEIQPKKQA